MVPGWLLLRALVLLVSWEVGVGKGSSYLLHRVLQQETENEGEKGKNQILECKKLVFFVFKKKQNNPVFQ